MSRMGVKLSWKTLIDATGAPGRPGAPVCLLRPGASRLSAPEAAEGAAHERGEQGQDARDRQDRAQILRLSDGLGGGLRGALHRTGQGDFTELIDKADAEDSPGDRQNQQDDKVEERHQEPVLCPGAARHPAGYVTADQESEQQRDQNPHEAGDAAGRGALLVESHGVQDGADDRADDAAQDEPGPQRRKPAEDDAGPARSQLILPALAVLFVLLARVPNPARAGPGAIVAGTYLVLLHPRRVGVALFPVGHALISLFRVQTRFSRFDFVILPPTVRGGCVAVPLSWLPRRPRLSCHGTVVEESRQYPTDGGSEYVEPRAREVARHEHRPERPHRVDRPSRYRTRYEHPDREREAHRNGGYRRRRPVVGGHRYHHEDQDEGDQYLQEERLQVADPLSGVGGREVLLGPVWPPEGDPGSHGPKHRPHELGAQVVGDGFPRELVG